MEFKVSGRIRTEDQGHRIIFGDNERRYQLWEKPGKDPGSHEFRLRLSGRTLVDFKTKEATDTTIQDTFINALGKACDALREEKEKINSKYDQGEVTQTDLTNRSDIQDAIFSCVIVENTLKKDRERGLDSMEKDWAKDFSDAVNEMSDKDPAPEQ